MPRSQVTPPSARRALLVFVAALVAGTALVLGVHRGLHAAGWPHPTFVTAPVAAGGGPSDRATP